MIENGSAAAAQETGKYGSASALTRSASRLCEVIENGIADAFDPTHKDRLASLKMERETTRRPQWTAVSLNQLIGSARFPPQNQRA